MPRRKPIPGVALIMVAEVLSCYTGWAIYPFRTITGDTRFQVTQRMKTW